MADRYNGNSVKYEKKDEERRTRKLFIGGVSFSTNDEDFFQYFAKFGELEDCVLIREKDTGQSRGFGFVTYKDRGVSEHVATQQLYLDGRRLDPKPSISRYNMDQIHEHRNQTTKVFVGGLHDDAVEAELTEHFKQFGDVLEVNIMYDRFTNAPRGFGFVTFKDPDVAAKVIEWDQDHMIHGKKVDCKPATARKDAFKRDPHHERDRDEGGGHHKKPTSREERWRKYHGDATTAPPSASSSDPYRSDPYRRHSRHDPYSHHDRNKHDPYSSHHAPPTHSQHSSYSHHSTYPPPAHSQHSSYSSYPPPHSTSTPSQQHSSYSAHTATAPAHSSYAPHHSSYPPPHYPPPHDPHRQPPAPTAPTTSTYDYARYDPYYRTDTRYNPHYPPPATATATAASTTGATATTTAPKTSTVSTSKTPASTVSAPSTGASKSAAVAPPTYDYSRYNPYPYTYDPNATSTAGASGAAAPHSRYNYYSQYGTVPPPQQPTASGATTGKAEANGVTSGKVAKLEPPTKVANSNQQTAVPTGYGASRGSAATHSAQAARYSAY